MKKNWTKVAIALGPVIVIATIVWEYAKTKSEYNFLIQPWAIRGHESDHGVMFVVLGILLLVGGIATSWEGSLKTSVAAGITAYFVIAATVFAFVFSDRTIEYHVTTVMNVMISLLLASAVSIALRSLLGERIGLFKRALPVALVVFFLLAAVFGLTVVGTTLNLRVWLVTLVVSLAFAALAVAIKPINMSANRLLILASVAGWAVIVLSAGALRQHLIDTQMMTEQANGAIGVAAQYKDTQAASGWWVAGFGATVLFVGAVGLWAKRRDIVAALARARKQRAAAEESAREIQEAAEAYAREQQQAAAPGSQ